ncbi:gamma-glutamyl-gamma-aminobutyrate hydrolase family protein [Amphibiibacter pelophylacis]|uniref:Gamma-glutamyl-gamma-aminobutyrate hydrolase family protein n=1 Tax=Amphibiibacter pelophylacis TaxID=1799477 RepID=A0ACC6P4T7_9BURK
MTPDAPLVGLSTYPVNDRGQFTMPSSYVLAVQRAGGIPVLLPPVSPAPVDAWLERLDALVLTGGGDIAPAHFGESAVHDTVYNTSDERDASELALVHAVLERRLPLLAICRGLQILNTALGGTLHQHLPDVVGEDTLHRRQQMEPIEHAVRVAPDSHLAGLIGESVTTQSWHHQAIAELAPGLQAVAWAPDGIIEAVELSGHPELMAVQWHPELSAPQDAGQQRLFDHLISSARVYRAAA